ncbi:LytTR family DNA-binding domain-containing protein [Paenibacillus chondroitinus]|uniref:LytTR family DNA-binding domain-containing protein n=1 Tax=Paenibacillus chondroitinus TaxID=59842 RepID=A0ABU6DCX3_9BACL|nr:MULTISPECIES: LytTR family DNA-binding domain-containing protein [Paenibacillus]MCY9662990.1 LytTR family DNA-binding domain-containing protein [Paenibacillus anseongense]MEB4795611.1 LytTR family DNA-binding domain-containing protein [Paenibacillus chondroitinus]
MGWNIVIADDEEPAREELIYLLESSEEVEKVTAATGGMDAIKKVKELAPDVLFLDMDMPDLSGLQVAEIVGEINPQVKIVFSTAYDQYAVHAFKLRAFHYMLKPYDEEDIAIVFRELRKSKTQPQNSAAAAAPGQTTSVKTSVKLALELEEGIRYVSPKDIMYISKEIKHVQVHLHDKAYNVSYTLSELEQKLEPYGFFRCHKSYLVNLAAISEMKTWVNGAYNLLMEDAGRSTIPVSRNYVKQLRLKLEI